MKVMMTTSSQKLICFMCLMLAAVLVPSGAATASKWRWNGMIGLETARDDSVNSFDPDFGWNEDDLRTNFNVQVKVNGSASDYRHLDVGNGTGYEHSLFGSVSGNWSTHGVNKGIETSQCSNSGPIATSRFAPQDESNLVQEPFLTTRSSSTNPWKGRHTLGPMALILGYSSAEDPGYCHGNWPPPRAEMGAGIGQFAVQEPNLWGGLNEALMLKLPTSGDRGPTRLPSGALRWTGSQTYQAPLDNTFEEYYISTSSLVANWTYDLTLTPAREPGCKIRAANIQRIASRRLKFNVYGRELGCKAELKSVVLRVGKKNRFRAKSAKAKSVKPRKTWKLGLRYGPVKSRILNKALSNARKVSAVITFELNGFRKTKVVGLI